MNTLSIDEKYMQRCLDLARMAEGNTCPNPMVGSIVVHNNKIIGEGYHTKAGEPHAEVNAINNVKNQSLLKEATIYVNLEPCAHFGKTPPCSLLIKEKQLARVVIGCIDTFSEVSGKGIKILQDAGIDVTVGVLEKQSRELNRRFFTYHDQKRPYVILKWAQTLDGYIDINRNSELYGQPTWITNDWARRAVHKQRSTEQAILVGTQTVNKDNPSLTVRDWYGKQPLRIVLDPSLRLSPNSYVFNKLAKTIVVNSKQTLTDGHLEYLKIDFNDCFPGNLLEELHKRDLQSIIIEGGKQTLSTFIDSNLWDEAHVYVGNKWFYDGIKAPKVKGRLCGKSEFNDSELFVYRNIL